MSEEPSPSTPHVVRVARLLGYLAAVLGAADIAWCLLAHDSVAPAPYTIGMMMFSATAVVAGIFAFLVQSDHRRAKREQVILAEVRAIRVETRETVRAEVRRILAPTIEILERSREVHSGQGLLRNQVERSIDWMSDVGNAVMRLDEKAGNAVASASAERAGLRQQLGLIRDDVREVMAEVIGPFVSSAIEAVKAELRGEIVAAVDPVTVRSAIEVAVTREFDVFLLDLAERRPEVVDLETVKILRQAQQRRGE